MRPCVLRVKVTHTAVDALVVATQTILAKGYGEPSPAWTRLVYLTTRADTAFSLSDAEPLQARLTQSSTALRILYVYATPRSSRSGIDFPRSPMDMLPPDVPDSLEVREACACTLMQWTVTAFWQRLLYGLVDAAFATPHEALAQAEEPAVQQARSAAASMALSFGDTDPDASTPALSIAVQVLKATAQQRPPAQKRVLRDTDKEPWERRIDARRVYYRASDLAPGADMAKLEPLPDAAVDTSLRAYKLGASLVPLHDLPEVSLSTRQGLEILHFVHAASVRVPLAAYSVSPGVPHRRNVLCCCASQVGARTNRALEPRAGCGTQECSCALSLRATRARGAAVMHACAADRRGAGRLLHGARAILRRCAPLCLPATRSPAVQGRRIYHKTRHDPRQRSAGEHGCVC